MRRCGARLFLLGACLGAAVAAPEKEPAGAKPTPQRIEAKGLEATFDLPEGWSAAIETDGGASGYKDKRIRDQILEARQLPNADFEVERGWWNNGEVLAQMRLRLEKKEFKGTLRDLADRSIAEIREKWPVFKAAKPAEKKLTLDFVPALHVTLNSREPPYRVAFVVLLAEGKGCGLFCYGWGPQANVVDLSNGQMPDSVRKIAEEARRLPPEKLKKQAALFREFETVIVPTLRVARARAPEAPSLPAR